MNPDFHNDAHTKQATAPSGGVDRRAALKLFVGGTALALASCGRPAEQVVPYVEMPERVTPGVPLRFASALPLAGYGRGVIVTSVEGRPIKIDGNPRHPASLGATDVFAEATVLSLYDPDRSKAPYSDTRIQSWSAFQAALLPRLERLRSSRGAGLVLLTGRTTSPTLLAQIGALTKTLPQTKWYRYEPVEDDAVRNGTILAFGRAVDALPRFADARVALLLDADPLGCGPDQIRFGRDIVGARRSHVAADSLRLYVAEPAWTLSGALADHRVALRQELIRNIALDVARTLGAPVPSSELPSDASQFAKAVAADLKGRRGAALVLAGPRQPADVQALCHWMNNALGAPVDYIAPVDPAANGHAQSLRDLVADLHAGRAETLIVIGANPAYDAAGELALGEAIATAPFSVHLGVYRDETAARCTWHLPMTHVLESWSDIRAFDGSASIVQPLIRPLYDTRTAHEVLAMLGGALAASPFVLVRSQWQGTHPPGDFDDWWRQSLQDGVIAHTAAAKISPPAPQLPHAAPAGANDGFTLTLSPDPSVFDGSVGNNAWLQECPKPFTKQVWGNALHLAEPDARELKLVDGDVLRITSGDTRFRSAGIGARGPGGAYHRDDAGLRPQRRWHAGHRRGF